MTKSYLTPLQKASQKCSDWIVGFSRLPGKQQIYESWYHEVHHSVGQVAGALAQNLHIPAIITYEFHSNDVLGKGIYVLRVTVLEWKR